MQLIRLVPPPHGSRHDHRVRAVSRRFDQIEQLRSIGLDRDTASQLIENAARTLDVAPPEVTFHGGRGPHTGYCQAPRDRVVEESGEAAVLAWETAKRRDWPINGMIRLGDPTSATTIAHELGHHLVNLRRAINTPSHGKVWIGEFDRATAVVAGLLSIEDQRE